jgi:glycosyltransferase involved in cell wall biosynthesis
MAARDTLRESLSKAVSQIACNREKFLAMSQNARNHVETNLTWQAKAAWFVELYRNVIQKSRQH